MSKTSDGTRLEPEFASSGNAPTFAADLSLVSAYAAEYGNLKIGTTVERNAFTAWEGLIWYDTTLDQIFYWSGSAWSRQAPYVRFKGTITTTKTVILSQYWGKSSGSVTFNSTDDPYSGFATATGLFTVPANAGGTYLLIGSLKADGSGAANAGITFHKGGTKVAQSPNTPSTVFGGMTFSYYTRCSAGDTLGMQATLGYTTQADSADNNFFQIVQVQY